MIPNIEKDSTKDDTVGHPANDERFRRANAQSTPIRRADWVHGAALRMNDKEKWSNTSTVSRKKGAGALRPLPRQNAMKGKKDFELPSNASIHNPCGDPKVDKPTNPCGQYKLPFKPDVVPPNCWPTIVLLPSYPTSGNELVHSMYEKITGLVSFHSFDGMGDVRAFSPSTEGHQAINLYAIHDEMCSSEEHLTMPYDGRIALAKNHYRNLPSQEVKSKYSMTKKQQSGNVGGGVAAVVRLARNPGDHLLRNIFRWSNRDCKNDECFFKRAPKSCSRVMSRAHDWNLFHSFWDDYDESVPQMIMHYEVFSQKNSAPGVFRDLLNFLGEKEKDPGMLEQKVLDYVREPTYETGALVAQVCGVGSARQLHNLTKEYSERLGYIFDDETGSWSLSNAETNALLRALHIEDPEKLLKSKTIGRGMLAH